MIPNRRWVPAWQGGESVEKARRTITAPGAGALSKRWQHQAFGVALAIPSGASLRSLAAYSQLRDPLYSQPRLSLRLDGSGSGHFEAFGVGPRYFTGSANERYAQGVSFD